jgi:hypothetical protein
MARIERLRVQRVDTMPDALEGGILYVSEECRLALHNCCCGCGEEVSTPLGATEYSLTVWGDDATLWPSIGNHDFACGSHYFISSGQVLWAGPMTRQEIDKGRAFDRVLKRGARPCGVRAVLTWLVGKAKKLWRLLNDR